MGTKITLPETFSATTGKLLLNDEILPASGALMLVDVGHSLGGLGAVGVPADLTTVPNIAWDQAAAMVGSGTATTLGAIFNRFDGTNFNLERTGKGGIHGYLSGNVSTSVGLTIDMPALIKTYLAANTTADFYISAWDRVTRVASSASGVWPMFEGIQRNSSATSNYLGFFDSVTGDGALPPSGNPKRLGARVTAKNSLGNTYRSIAADGWTGTAPTSASEISDYLALWGAIGPYAGFFNGNTAPPSYILYRLYVENLTVSGRTWAQVDAIDYAMWQRDFGAGGRFAGDTFTASPI